MKNIKQLAPAFEETNFSDFRDLLNRSAEKFGQADAFIIKHSKSRKDFEYEHISFSRFRDDVLIFGEGLLSRHGTGKKIAIVGKNRYEWILSYFAVLGGLGICVPLDKGLPYEELESPLIRSGSDILIFDKAHLKDVERLKEENKTRVSEFIAMDELEGYATVSGYMSEGKRLSAEGRDGYRQLPVDPEKIDILLFTSGTTSMAKAVMLSQGNIMANLNSIDTVIKVWPGDVSMAFLPYHHTFGTIGQFVMIAQGATTTYCDGLRYLQKNLVEYKVSVFFCVPLLIESIYKKVMTTVRKEGREKKLAFGMKVANIAEKFGINLRRRLFSEILEQLGGEIRMVVSGASAIDPVAMEGFKSFGIVAMQGYGMTESSPVICVENEFEQKNGSIGRPLPNLEVRIDNPDDKGVGELIARGPSIMAGYYENDEETSRTLVDGWLHTGDLAYTDEDGFVFICGRKKNVIVLKNGKNVYPEELEVLVSNLPYVEECMVYGEPRGNDGDENNLAVCVKIVYNPEYMSEHYEAESKDRIDEVIKADIEAINDTLPTYKQMLRVVATDQEMIKTTTGKIKRYAEMSKEQ
ncbi:MAG: AMP-binding protein [Lentihominibacter sp.]